MLQERWKPSDRAAEAIGRLLSTLHRMDEEIIERLFRHIGRAGLVHWRESELFSPNSLGEALIAFS